MNSSKPYAQVIIFVVYSRELFLPFPFQGTFDFLYKKMNVKVHISYHSND